MGFSGVEQLPLTVRGHREQRGRVDQVRPRRNLKKSVGNFLDGFSSGLPDGFFQTKNPNLGKCWRALDWKNLYFIAIWNI
jgi:hypothetical protein